MYRPTTVYLVRDPEVHHAEEWVEYKAWDAADAAERYARDHDEPTESYYTDGESVLIEVKDPDGELTAWRVSAEWSLEYDAQRSYADEAPEETDGWSSDHQRRDVDAEIYARCDAEDAEEVASA